jgi:hypothetical protein
MIIFLGILVTNQIILYFFLPTYPPDPLPLLGKGEFFVRGASPLSSNLIAKGDLPLYTLLPLSFLRRGG